MNIYDKNLFFYVFFLELKEGGKQFSFSTIKENSSTFILSRNSRSDVYVYIFFWLHLYTCSTDVFPRWNLKVLCVYLCVFVCYFHYIPLRFRDIMILNWLFDIWDEFSHFVFSSTKKAYYDGKSNKKKKFYCLSRC